MLIIRRISTAIDVNDCIGVYTDPNNIYAMIVNTYEGICCFGCYVVKVLQIIKIGECEINRDGAPSFGTIPVVFDAQVIVYLPGEIVNGCVINEHRNGLLICNTKIANISIKSSPLIASLAADQIISVRVGKVMYPFGTSRVAINAVVFFPSKESVVYQCDAKSMHSATTREYLGDVLKRVTEEEQRIEILSKSNAKGIAFFTQVLYAYNGQQSAPAGVSIMDMKKLIGTNTGGAAVQYLSRDRRLDLLRPNVYVYDKEPSTEGVTNIVVVDSLTTQDVMLSFFEDYCMYIRTLREMIECYSTVELLSSHKNLWAMYGKSK